MVVCCVLLFFCCFFAGRKWYFWKAWKNTRKLFTLYRYTYQKLNIFYYYYKDSPQKRGFLACILSDTKKTTSKPPQQHLRPPLLRLWKQVKAELWLLGMALKRVAQTAKEQTLFVKKNIGKNQKNEKIRFCGFLLLLFD